MLSSVLVRDHMTSAMIRFKPTQDIVEAAHILLEYQLMGAPVVDEHERLIGYLSEKECLHIVVSATFNQDYGDLVKDRMCKDLKICHPTDDITTIAERFLAEGVHTYPVIEKGVLVGMISRRTVLHAFCQLTHTQPC